MTVRFHGVPLWYNVYMTPDGKTYVGLGFISRRRAEVLPARKPAYRVKVRWKAKRQ